MVYLLIVLGIFCLDYQVKSYIDSHHLQGVNEEYLGGKLILKNYHNGEGGFSLFKRNPEVGINLSFVVLICVGWEFVKLLFTKGYSFLKIGLGLILGGGLSNFHDRKTKGYVTDYFSFGVGNKKFRNTVFNLSDLFIFAGAAIYMIAQVLSAIKKK